MDHLTDRVALVTGAASGIGLAMAQALSREGVRVVLADIDETRLAFAREQVAGDTMACRLDVVDRENWKHALQAVEDHFGPVDIVCNNAGIASDGHTLAEMSPVSFDRVIAINLAGTFNGISACVPGMIARWRGHVVNTASLAGLVHPPTVGAYSAAKAGVIALSESLRAEVAAAGVGVTVVCPGQVRTRIDETTRAAGSDRPSVPPDPTAQARIIEPDEVGSAVVDAIRRNLAYVITHGEFSVPFEARIAGIKEAFSQASCG